MKCPKCKFKNREGVKFCEECGVKFELECPACKAKIPLGRKFCGECGYDLSKSTEAASLKESEHDTQISELPPEEPIPTRIQAEGERKHVTVLFSDLTGYTAMSEKLDPEEVKEITGRIFGEISEIIKKYGGFIEKYAGDAIMALFGATKSHEDDPIRAIKAAGEIHDLVKSLSPRYEEKIGQALFMHTGINTGLVVTGKVDQKKGIHGVAGDSINVAARLSGLAEADAILVGPDTYAQAEGYFNFESQETTQVKGKTKPILIYKVLSTKDRPRKIHRLHGLRADLIGRKAEMTQLSEAIENLRNGKGAIFSIIGPAGTGKSRLVDEFKTTLDLKKVQWREGHAFPYAQNIPYFLLINLMNRAFQIEEGDSPQKVKDKVETSLSRLVENEQEIAPYIGSLYALRYPETDRLSPEIWKAQLQKAIQTTLSALAMSARTIICLEDLHWADNPSIELIRFLLSEIRHPVIFICVYRPTVTLFSDHQIKAMAHPHKEISLKDLSASETQDMVASLLKTEKIPVDLQRFVQEKVEGNPFYLEEAINSLIESKVLVRVDDSRWVTGPITELEISPTIHGVISARVDRLEKESKRTLQEASVIGRTFYYEILNKISDFKDSIDVCLSGLERLDLIKTKSIQPDLEYIFKHALTQEVVYSGLLKIERRDIHDRIAIVIEKLFSDRLKEYYETIAYHYVKGHSQAKAIEYLIKSAEKSRDKYALEESHRYFKQAYQILLNKIDKSEEEKKLFVGILIKWAIVLHWRGAYAALVDLFKTHENLLPLLDDEESVGMTYAWLGWALHGIEELKESQTCLRKALEIGEKIKNQKVIGYANAWLAFTYSQMGYLNEAVDFGQTANDISSMIEFDPELFRFALLGLSMAYWYRGDSKKTLEVGKLLIDYGQKSSDIRCLTMGHITAGIGYMTAGNYDPAIKCYQKAKQMSLHPTFSLYANLLLGSCNLAWGRLEEVEDYLMKVLRFDEKSSIGVFGTSARGYLGILSIAKGNIDEGIRISEEVLKIYLEKNRLYLYVVQNYSLGRSLLQMIKRDGPEILALNLRKITSLIKNSPSISNKAEEHLNEAKEIAKEIGAKIYLALAYLDLGLLHEARKKTDKARQSISKAIKLFEECEADGFLKEAKNALESLG